jgi:hypothetical protein
MFADQEGTMSTNSFVQALILGAGCSLTVFLASVVYHLVQYRLRQPRD